MPLATRPRFEVGVEMVVLRHVRAFFRVFLALRHHGFVHVAVHALFNRAVRLDLHIAVAGGLPPLIGALDWIGRFVVPRSPWHAVASVVSRL